MSAMAVRWGVGLATTGFMLSRLLGDVAHRERVLKCVEKDGHATTPSHMTAKQTLTTFGKLQQDPGNPGLRKLHIYDHCPFCVRVQLVAGWKDMKHDVEIYGYGDLVGPTKLTGKKVLPVMEFVDENGTTHLMPESGDQINHLDAYNGEANRQFAPATRQDLKDWVKRTKNSQRILTYGPKMKMPIKDWKTEADIAYSVKKYESKGFDYGEAERLTPQHLKIMETYLEELSDLLHSENSANSWGRSMDDVYLIPELRTLSVLKELKWPEKVKNYLEKGLSDAGLSSYSEHAV